VGSFIRQQAFGRDRGRLARDSEANGDSSTIVFDTSAIIDFLRRGEKTGKIVEQAQREQNRIAATTISLFELLSPVYHRRLLREEKSIRSFARQALMLGLDFASGEESSKIMGSLLRLGKPVNALDVLISGIAVANGADTIVTADRDFETIQKVASIDVLLI
jgi:tRNA(fMet)-specific endonuclease VapC